jgi:hypothetical protein
MFKKLIVPVGLLIVGLFAYGKFALAKKLEFIIKKIRLNFSFTQQIIEVTIGFINKTNQSALVRDLNGKLYFVDVTKKEYFIGYLTSSNINILPNAITYQTFNVNLFTIGLIGNLISLITNRKGDIRFIGKANAMNLSFPIDYTYKLN